MSCNSTEHLFARKCELQRQVLQSWERLQLAQQAHNRLLSELRGVRWQLENQDVLNEFLDTIFSEV